MEPFIPEWYILNIGINQFEPQNTVLYDIPNFNHSEMKYFEWLNMTI